MKHRKKRRNGNLQEQIEALQAENEFLHNGINMREVTNDVIRKDKDTQIYIIKHLTYLILFMESIEYIVKDNHNSISKIIMRAIIHFKQELVNNFFADGNEITIE